MRNNFPESAKKGAVNIKDWFSDAIRFTHTLSYYNDQDTYSASGSGEVVRLHFGIKGNYNIYYPQMQKSYELVGGHHNIIYANPFDMEFCNKTPEIETFGIQFPRQLFIDYTKNTSDSLSRFSENILKGEGAILSNQWGTIDLPIQQVINQVLACGFTDEIRKLYFFSKSIELLVLCAESYAIAAKRNNQFIKDPSDKEKIIAARDLVNKRIESPPTLSEISRLVELNECKLKRGFKELFGTTIFNYLTSQRLNLAKQYLLDTHKNVAEVAYELGYATPQHFNNAFRKKFGVTPNLVRKNS